MQAHRRTVSAFTLLAMSLGLAQAKTEREDVHKPEVDCARCHTVGRPVLEENPAAAPHQVVPDVEQRCTACHDEGPSHRTGLPPAKPVPDILPLSDTGLITCSTCHFVHGERNPYGDFVRIDNSRGALCLTCHKLEELQ
jgi:hypothetical protein